MSQIEAIDFTVARRDDTRRTPKDGGVRRRGWLIRRALLSADVLALGSALVLAETTAGHGLTLGDAQHRPVELTLAALALPLWAFAAKLYGLYDRDEERTDHSTLDELVSVFHLVTTGAWIFFVIGWWSGFAEPNLRKLVVFWFAATCLVTGYRAVARAVCRHQASYVQNTVIVGAGEIGQLVARKLIQHPEYGIELVGFIDAEPRERHDGMEHVPLLGGPDELPEACRRLGVERVVVAFSRQDARETLNVIRSLRELDVQIDLVPRLFEILGPSATMHSVEGVPLVGLSPVRLTRSSRFVKRLMDVVGASLLLCLTAPFFLVLALWVRLSSAGPVFFTQKRLGFEMKEFTAIKFRTMHVNANASAHREYIRATMDRSAAPGADGFYKLPRTAEVTSAGRFLRKTSLDELPQLINVLRGEMSLVGPRPCIGYETEFFEPHHFERFLVPQGLTGLWQVTARARSTFAEALDMDVAYARSWSLELDLKLLFKTPLQLFRLKGSA